MTNNNALRACLVLLTGVVASGCDYGDDRYDDGYVAPSSVCGELANATIDVGLGVEADAGVSLIIEYAAGGLWSVRTACDTKTSGAACTWDVLVEPVAGAQITKFAANGSEFGDELGWYDDGILHFGAYTEETVKGFTFDATPAGAMRFDILLDGQCAGPHVYWHGDGAVHSGAPSNPIEFTPSGA